MPLAPTAQNTIPTDRVTHTVHFMQPILPHTLQGLQTCCMTAIQQGATDITIHLSSEGGNNDQGFAAYHFLRSLPVSLTIHCIGNIESMAIILFLAADKRLIVPHGKIKAHAMHWGFNAGTIDHDRLAEFVDSLDFDAKRYEDIFVERTKGATKALNIKEHLAGRAKILSAAEGVEAGIVTKIADAAVARNSVKWWV